MTRGAKVFVLALIGITLLFAYDDCRLRTERARFVPEEIRIFEQNRAVFEECIRMVWAREVEELGGDQDFPAELYRCNVSGVTIEEDFVFFHFRPDWPDDPYHVIGYVLDVEGPEYWKTTLLKGSNHRYTVYFSSIDDRWFCWIYD